jgi:hypothetical protein
MTKITTIEKQIKEQQQVLANLEAQLNEAKPNKMFTCSSCGKRSKVKSLTLVKRFYYVDEPYSERWDFSEYIIICAKCGEQNRCVSSKGDMFKGKKEPWKTWGKHHEIADKYRNHFKEVLAWYPRRRGLFGEQLDLDKLREDAKRSKQW